MFARLNNWTKKMGVPQIAFLVIFLVVSTIILQYIGDFLFKGNIKDAFSELSFPQTETGAKADTSTAEPYYVNILSGYLNLRSTPSRNGKIRGIKLNSGDVVLVTEIVDGWGKILTADNSDAYAYMGYLSKEKPVRMSASGILEYKVKYIGFLEHEAKATELNGSKSVNLSSGYIAFFDIQGNIAIFAKDRSLYYLNLVEFKNLYVVGEDKGILCAYTTFFNQSYDNRVNNITVGAVAMQKTLEPGEEYSFNAVVGERTEAKGYLYATAYNNYEKIQAIGGGVCQLSSTLFAAIRQSPNFTDIHAIAHDPEVSYLPIGMDATVNYPSRDFRFTNSYPFPVQILTFVSEGRVTVLLQRI